MKLLSLFARKPVDTPSIEERLIATLRPDPEARARRLSQWDSARRQRYFDACYGTPQSLRGQG